MNATRTIDSGSPLFLDANTGGEPHGCGRGVCIDTPFDVAVAERELVLSLRRAEWHDGSATVEDDRIHVNVSLATGSCSPRDATADRFLAEHRWLPEALLTQLDWLRSRAHRRALQRDRSTCDAALSRAVRGEMLTYDQLFPGDWDLVFKHEGRNYWAVDHHCPNPECACGETLVVLHDLSGEHAPSVGDVRLDFTTTPPNRKASSPRAARLFDALWRKNAGELTRRYIEVRNAVRPRAGTRTVATRAFDFQPRPQRNDPCPCGSGRKFKRCCVDRGRLPAP